MSEMLKFTHSFRYREFEGLIKPVIEVIFSYKGNELSYPMLVDSGSIATALPVDLAVEAFQIDDITQLPESLGSGINSRFHKRKLDDVDIIIVENEIELKGPVYFIEGLTSDKMPYGVLGRETVFEALRIGFREYRTPNIYIALENA